MRNMLAFLGAVVVTVLVVGWYLDWFTVHRGPSSDGKTNYTVEVDEKKIKEDLQKGEAKLKHTTLETTPPSSIPPGLEETSHYTPEPSPGPIPVPPSVPEPQK